MRTETKPIIKTIKELPPRSLFRPLASGSSDYMVVDNEWGILSRSDRVWAISLYNGHLRSFWRHHRVKIVHFHLLIGDEQSEDMRIRWNSRKHD